MPKSSYEFSLPKRYLLEKGSRAVRGGIGCLIPGTGASIKRKIFVAVGDLVDITTEIHTLVQGVLRKKGW